MTEVYLSGLCTIADGPFWSNNLTTLNRIDPDLTRCFEYSIMEWASVSYLLFIGGIHVYRLTKKDVKVSKINISRFCLIKTVLSLILAILALSMALVSITADDGPVMQLGLWSAFASYCMAASLIVYEFRKQVNSSGVLFWFWLIRLVCSAIELQTIFRHSLRSESDGPLRILLLLTVILTTVQLILHGFADNQALAELYPDYVSGTSKNEEQIPLRSSDTKKKQPTNGLPPCPAIFSSFLSRVTYQWFNSFAMKGKRTQLTLADCWELQDEFKAETHVPRIMNAWKKEVDSVTKQQQRRRATIRRGSMNDSGAEELLADRRSFIENPSISNQDSHQIGKKPSFVRPFLVTMMPTYLLSALYRIFFDILTLSQPLVLNLLLDVLSGTDPIRWHGAVFTVGLVLQQLVRMVLVNEHYKLNWYWAMEARTVLVSAIYRKALRMSTSARKDATAGEIVNLMSVDTQRICDASYYVHMPYWILLNIVVGCVLLYLQLGVAAASGIAVLLLLVPINVWLSHRFEHYQSKQLVRKDERLKLMTEVLNGVKILKLYGWESSFANLVNGIRKLEVAVLKLGLYFQSFETVTFFVSPFLISFFSFLTYILVDESNVLTPTKVFSSLNIVNILNTPISMMSLAVTMNIQFWISLKRIEKFMQSEEVSDDAITQHKEQKEAILMEKTDFAWDASDRVPFLQNINLRIRVGSLVSVVGHVGSGKTSLLHAILGEMHRLNGNVSLNGKVAYVPQQAWIFNATIRENITFGQPFSQQRYNRVVEACALTTDLAMFPAGDQTEIGERGVNLSGGQKQRISLARAVYQANASIFLLDDPLSAVDAHVGRHIFEHVIGPNGLLMNKTRIFVTHRLSTLPSATSVVVMRQGEISESGSFEDLMERNGGFAEFIREFLTEEELRHSSDEESAEKTADSDERTLQKTLLKRFSLADSLTNFRTQTKSITRTNTSRKRQTVKMESEKEKVAAQGQLILEEEVKLGNLKGTVYRFYFRAIGLLSFAVTLTAYACVIIGMVGTNEWLGIWTSKPVNLNDSQQYRSETITNLVIYASIGFFQVLAILVETVMISYGLCNAARILHDVLMHRVMRAPTSFFDITPLGRITNRFSRDIEAVDTQIPQNIPYFFFYLASASSTLVIIAITAPILILLVVPILIIFWITIRIYVSTASQMKRIDSVLRSPIYDHFHTTLLGATSIRAYLAQDRFMARCDQLMNQNQRTVFVQVMSYRWLYVLLETLNCVIVGVTCTFALTAGDSLAGGMASLLVTYPLALTNTVYNVLRYGADLETYMVSVERIEEYTKIESEAPLEVSHYDSQLPSDWPSSGRVEFKDYSVRYRAGLDLVLRNVTLSINGGEKVGIVGRTGAGKSSLSLALFRIIEAATGAILIDGVDISRLGLQKLRTRLTIIPQDPVLFSGMLRTNLDPFGAYSDDEIWRSLESAHLQSFVASLDGQLSYVCAEGGENFSVGQRQLLCLARALLRRTKILLLDEATAAVDMETDELIQKTIRDKFADCTILTIAHRLNTIMDYDKILVLEQGRVKEFDSPTSLLADSTTVFYSLAKDARLV